MISPELLRRYPFFAGLSHEHLVTLANVAEEMTVDAGHFCFREGEPLNSFYLVVEGSAAIVLELPDSGAEQSVAGQLTGEIKTRDVVVTAIGPGQVFAWSALVSPYVSTASAKALTSCRSIVFDCVQLRKTFDDDCEFGFRMMEKIAQVIRGRMRDLRIESLASIVDQDPVMIETGSPSSAGL